MCCALLYDFVELEFGRKIVSKMRKNNENDFRFLKKVNVYLQSTVKKLKVSNIFAKSRGKSCAHMVPTLFTLL